MSTEKTWQIHSASSADTEAFGERIGARLAGGEIIELVGDLGGGKTTFVRGLVRGAGSDETVASPTFTISREYTAPAFIIIHFDFYRLYEPGIIANELREFIGDTRSVVVIEWGEMVQDILPAERITIYLKHAGDDTREIECRCVPSQNYLFEDAV